MSNTTHVKCNHVVIVYLTLLPKSIENTNGNGTLAIMGNCYIYDRTCFFQQKDMLLKDIFIHASVIFMLRTINKFRLP